MGRFGHSITSCQIIVQFLCMILIIFTVLIENAFDMIRNTDEDKVFIALLNQDGGQLQLMGSMVYIHILQVMVYIWFNLIQLERYTIILQ